MADTFNDLRAEVLDWLSLDASDAQYDGIIQRAVNNVTARLNHGPLLMELAKQVSLSYNLPANFNSSLTENPRLQWFGATESWTVESQTDWQLNGDAADISASNPVTVDGDPYSGQTGEALNEGNYLHWLYIVQGDGTGQSVVGSYQSQIIKCLPGREYTLNASMYLYGSSFLFESERRARQPEFEGWEIARVVTPNGESLEVVSSANTLWPDESPDYDGPIAPSITFKVGTTPGLGADDLVDVELRVGFNTSGEIAGVESFFFIEPGVGYAVQPKYDLIQIDTTLTKGLAVDTMITSATLPDDCRNVVTIKLGGRDVRSLDQHKDDPRYRTNLPYYKRDGLQIEFSHALDPENLPSGVLRYIPDIPKIDDNNKDADHVGIKRWRRTYLFGALCDTCAATPDYEARNMYKADYAEAYAELLADQNRRQKQSTRQLYVRRY